MVTFLYAISHWREKYFYPANDTFPNKFLIGLPAKKDLRGMIGSSASGSFW